MAEVVERLRIDKDGATPAYLQLAQKLRVAITSGDLSAGSALLPERELAQQLHLSRMTVRRAVEALVEEGLLVRRHGSGTYVRRPSVEQTFDRVLGFTDEARNLGFTPGSLLLAIKRQRADEEVAARLRIASGSSVLSIRRLRTADQEPLAIQTAYLPPALAELSPLLLEERGSLYLALAEQFQLSPHRARQTVSARLPDTRERQLLELGPYDPVLELERVTFDVRGEPFEYVRSAYRGDRYRLALDLRPPEQQGES